MQESNAAENLIIPESALSAPNGDVVAANVTPSPTITAETALPGTTIATNAQEPAQAANDSPFIPAPLAFNGMTPPHTHTESTLAPTSEFMRYVLAALPSRYVLRGLFGLGFDGQPHGVVDRGRGIQKAVLDFLGKPGDMLNERFHWRRDNSEAAIYNAALGIGSLSLTWMYSSTVYKDIKNIFSEAVGAELNKPADQVNDEDLKHSQNKIVSRTLDNFHARLWHRLAIDALFLPAAFLRKAAAGDLVLGLKGAQLFMETWKRKTTMFEDLVTFVNNKINPRNGLGQPIVLGEVFDLYQHYEQEFNPDRAFTNVLERPTGEGLVWAQGEPIFRRITELMNQTYAYKHPTIIDPKTGQAVQQANFPLPTFIYLLGNDLIDLHQPEKTRVMLEVANQQGIQGVKEMQSLLATQTPLPQIMQHFHVKLPALHTPGNAPESPKNDNGVIIKGSSAQLNAVPLHQIAANDIERPNNQIAANDVQHTGPMRLMHQHSA